MARIAVIAGLVLALLAPGAAATPPAPNAMTPDGHAILTNYFTHGLVTDRRPQTLVAWTVAVGGGGNAGPVRVLVNSLRDPRRLTLFSDWVTLPAEPGVYTFPAPRMLWDSASEIRLEQQIGGHAIVHAQPCRPELGPAGDPCQTVFLSPTLRGQQLTLEAVTEVDWDADYLADRTEDRTDLRLETRARAAASGFNDWVVTATVRNAGPRAADLPTLALGRASSEVSGCLFTPWPPTPRDASPLFPPLLGGRACRLPPIAPGQSREVTWTEQRTHLRAWLYSEGPDLAPADNVVDTLRFSDELALSGDARQRLEDGINVDILSGSPGVARLTAAVAARGRTVRLARTVRFRRAGVKQLTWRARGAKLRSLRRAGRRLRATVSVRLGGRTVQRRILLVR